MTTKIQRWGNSLGVRIPQQLTKKYGLVNGSPVQIKEDGSRIVIEPIKEEYTLEQLIAQCEGDNPHTEIFAEPIGKEEI